MGLTPFIAIRALALSLVLSPIHAQFQPIGAPFKAPVTTASGLSARVAFSNLTSPRGIAWYTTATTSNLLVVERGLGLTSFKSVTTPSPGWERTVLVKNANLTHGIDVDVDAKKVYVTTASDAWVYTYDSVSGSIDNTVPPYVVVDGLPADGELQTHTILVEKASNGTTTALLIGSGPLTNIDPTARDPASGRSQVRRFVFPFAQPTIFPPPPLHWKDGQVIAYGIRNPAGFAFGEDSLTSPLPQPARNLYVVENGASIDNVTGFTPLFVNDNPADELELVTFSNSSGGSGGMEKSYGFPDCTTLWNGDADPVGDPQYVGLPRGTQISLNLEPARGDKWCQDKANNVPPVVSFQAHSVPLDIKFYTKPTSPGPVGSGLPTSYIGDAFVSFHGSFNRSPPTGYGVVVVPFPLGGISTSPSPYTFIVQARDINTCTAAAGGTCIRPVGLSFAKDGNLFVSSDSTGELFFITQSSFTTNPQK